MDRLPTGKSMVAGWGRTTKIHRIGEGDFEETGAFSAHLLKVVLPVRNGTQCKKDFPIFRRISSEKHLCVGGVKGIYEENIIWSRCYILKPCLFQEKIHVKGILVDLCYLMKESMILQM